MTCCAAIRSCWASLYSVESLSYRRRQGIAGSRAWPWPWWCRRMVDARTAGVMFTRSPTHRRSLGDHDRGRLGPGLGGGQRRGDAGSLGGGQDHRRDLRCATSPTRPSGTCRPPGGGTEERPVEEAQRRAPCLRTRSCSRCARWPARSSVTTAGRRTSSGPSTGNTQRILLLQSRPETVWSNKDTSRRRRQVSDPLLHVMSIFGGQR